MSRSRKLRWRRRASFGTSSMSSIDPLVLPASSSTSSPTMSRGLMQASIAFAIFFVGMIQTDLLR